MGFEDRIPKDLVIFVSWWDKGLTLGQISKKMNATPEHVKNLWYDMNSLLVDKARELERAVQARRKPSIRRMG